MIAILILIACLYIIHMSDKRYRKINKKLRRMEGVLIMINTQLEEDDEDDDDEKPEWDKEAEDYIDYQIKLASWERKKELENKKNER
jgi:hypothetical protein